MRLRQDYSILLLSILVFEASKSEFNGSFISLLGKQHARAHRSDIHRLSCSRSKFLAVI